MIKGLGIRHSFGFVLKDVLKTHQGDASAALLAAVRVGRRSPVTLAYPAVVRPPPLLVLLLRVLAQQGGHLLLVVEWTGTERGLQPDSGLGKPTEKKRK